MSMLGLLDPHVKTLIGKLVGYERWLEAQPPDQPPDQFMWNAVLSGHLDYLQFLRAGPNPCPWDEMTCIHAAYNGHLDCLQWLHEHGCP